MRSVTISNCCRYVRPLKNRQVCEQRGREPEESGIFVALEYSNFSMQGLSTRSKAHNPVPFLG